MPYLSKYDNSKMCNFCFATNNRIFFPFVFPNFFECFIIINHDKLSLIIYKIYKKNIITTSYSLMLLNSASWRKQNISWLSRQKIFVQNNQNKLIDHTQRENKYLYNLLFFSFTFFKLASLLLQNNYKLWIFV